MTLPEPAAGRGFAAAAPGGLRASSPAVLEPPSRRERPQEAPPWPPSTGGGGDGPGRDDSGGWRGRRDGPGDGSGGGPGEEGGARRGLPISAGMLMLGLFLCAVTMLFGAFIAAIIVLRAHQASWPPAELSPLPGVLPASAAVILLSSVTAAGAVRAAGKSRALLRVLLAATTLLGILFLWLQLQAWSDVHGRVPSAAGHYVGFFYLLTGVHGLHVAGGVIALLILTLLSLRPRPGPRERHGVLLGSVYWHFVDGLWILLYGVLSGVI